MIDEQPLRIDSQVLRVFYHKIPRVVNVLARPVIIPHSVPVETYLKSNHGHSRKAGE